MNKLLLLWFGIHVILSLSLAQAAASGPGNFGQAISTVTTTLKGIWSGGKQFVEGMGQSFGFVSSDYKYNFIVFNDAPKAIYVAKQHITGFMGTQFSGDVDNSITLLAGSNSGDTFQAQQLYASIWLCGDKSELTTYAKSASEGAAWGSLATPLGTILGGIIGGIVTTAKLEDYKIYSRDLSLGAKNDPNWYYYRTYTYQGSVQGEYLGVKAKTNDFAGVFFNNSSLSTLFFSFTKDGTAYKVNLEPNSYNLLQSTAGIDGSIRPKTGQKAAFQFYSTSNNTFTDATSIAYIPIAEVGIANIAIDPSTKVQSTTGPMTYTYELHIVDNQPTISIQGLAVGHYDQPCSSTCQTGQALSLVRDINPAQCHVWHMSAAQAQAAEGAQSQSSSPAYYDGTDQVWVSYQSSDCTYQQKIMSGKVLDFGLIRPRLSEKQSMLYVVALQTTDDGAAQKFLTRLHAGTIGQGAFYTSVTSGDIDQFVAGKTDLLVSPQPNVNGVIDDTDTQKDPLASGIKGELLLADIFTPRGVGVGPFYYVLQASSLEIDALTSKLYLADSNYNADRSLKATVMQDLSAKFISWIGSYGKDQAAVKNDLVAYLQQQGNAQIFSNPKSLAAQRNLNDVGANMVNDVLTGAISIAHPPLIRQAGKNCYVYALGDAPTDWPKK